MSVSPALLDQTLAVQGEALVAYVRQRLGPEAAEDVVQDALLRVVERAPELDDEADLTRWLWRVVRNATVDAHRRAEASERREEAWAAEQPDAEMPPGEEAVLCACYRPLLDDLDRAHADVLRAELGGEASAATAPGRPWASGWPTCAARARAASTARAPLPYPIPPLHSLPPPWTPPNTPTTRPCASASRA